MDYELVYSVATSGNKSSLATVVAMYTFEAGKLVPAMYCLSTDKVWKGLETVLFHRLRFEEYCLRASAAPLSSCVSEHVWTSSPVWNRGTGAAVNQPPVRSASFPLPVWLSRYHYCYGVEPHKRKQPCTEPAVPQHTYTLGSKNRIYLFGGFEVRE
ncbi:hypothetical protein T11_5091 [Trichinella zimbabwensis]|uniref:Uncharacterized protein n=1 Tax=Trichinella zimbabwensis TaxID=268475 RepID=A0A0V1H568_9BILA|nr:hypothetical protein T11_5091 [Trichinella zimbabwensis]